MQSRKDLSGCALSMCCVGAVASVASIMPSGNGKAKMPEVDWLPSTGWRPAPHHLASKRLWERIQQEARDDAVRSSAFPPDHEYPEANSTSRRHCWAHVCESSKYHAVCLQLSCMQVADTIGPQCLRVRSFHVCLFGSSLLSCSLLTVLSTAI